MQADSNAALPQTNTNDIEQFLSFLAGMTGEKEVFTYALMDMESESVIPGCGIVHGKSSDILNTIKSSLIVDNDATIHVCLNRTNMRGRKSSDMVSCRVLCADLDTSHTVEEIRDLIKQYSPGMVVESSEGKYHLYWKVDSVIPLPIWSELQLGLAELLRGDYALSQVTHTIRVPGVLRMRKGKPCMPRIVWFDPEHKELTHVEIVNEFAGIISAAADARKTIAEQNKAIRKAVRAARKGKVAENVDAKLGRNNYLFSYLKEWMLTCEEMPTIEEVTEEAYHTNKSAFSEGLSSEEVAIVVKKVWKRGVAICEGKKKKRDDLLNKLVIQSPITENGAHVNGINGNGSSSCFEYDYTHGPLAVDRFSDRALIERILQRFSAHIIRTGKIVYAFDVQEKLWRSQKTSHELLQYYATQCADEMMQDTAFLALPDKRLAREMTRLQSFKIISQTISFVLNEHRLMRKDISSFDEAPWLFYARNGVVNLLTGECREAQASDLLLKQAAVAYDPEAKCPYFENFIREVFAENEEPEDMVRFVQELFGYSITGATNEQTIFLHAGDGANGKSRLLSALAALTGDYCSRMQSGALTQNKTAVEKEIARMGAKIEGKRVMIIDDLDTKTQWDVSLVKALTEKKMVARNLYEEEKDIPNRAKIHIGCNQTPQTNEPGHALMRRVCIIEYGRTFEVNPSKLTEIDESIEAELPGVLNWAIIGLLRIQARPDKKIKWPIEVEERLKDYKEAHKAIDDEDLGQWLLKPTDVTHRYTVAEILEFLEKEAAGAGLISNLTPEKLGRTLKRMGFDSVKTRESGKFPRRYLVKFSEESKIEQLLQSV